MNIAFEIRETLRYSKLKFLIIEGNRRRAEAAAYRERMAQFSLPSPLFSEMFTFINKLVILIESEVSRKLLNGFFLATCANFFFEIGLAYNPGYNRFLKIIPDFPCVHMSNRKSFSWAKWNRQSLDILQKSYSQANHEHFYFRLRARESRNAQYWPKLEISQLTGNFSFHLPFWWR